MRKIALITTGGTIAMKSNKTGLAEPMAGGMELLSGLPALGNITVQDIDFINIPSAHISHEDLVELRKLIIKLKEEDYDGIVITHGTDTLEETAYFLDLTTDLNIPIVLTGAQRNLSAISSDFQINIVDSILVAANAKAGKYGPLIVFASEVFLAKEATKTHKTRVSTFKSQDFGPVGTIDNGKVLWFREPNKREIYGIGDFKNIKVDIVKSYLGSDSRLLLNSVNDKVDGIIYEGLGAGHVPERSIEGVKKAIENDIPVILTSRVPEGRLMMGTYGFVGSEKYLVNMGVILGDYLPSHKARLKLMVLLSLGYSYEQIKFEFEKNCYI
ncbi:MAG: asparaginase [Firmicutes bacterium]|nr:asparaginase [Bacillota bacterium]